ncbi:hypothetical protein T439DRAFT_383970 [Meredithblackwellia eburnea MCA 4105]
MTVVNVLSLPPEVHSNFRGPAQFVLFSQPVIRNVGRAALLERTISTDDSLASCLRSFTFKANTMQDTGHPQQATSILRHTKPCTVTLGARLFDENHREAATELRKVLTDNKDLQSFTYGFHTLKQIPFHDLLPAWTKLKHLSLNSVAFPFATPGIDGLPSPTYHLHSLTLTGVFIQSFEDLLWTMGRTTTSLRSLHLEGVTFGTPHDAAPTPFTATQLAGLTHLALHHLYWIHVDHHDPLNFYPCRANQILPFCTSLKSLSIGDERYDRTGTQLNQPPLPRLALPSSVTQLEVLGKTLFWKCRVRELIREDKSMLESVVLVGPSVTTMGVHPLASSCAGAGVLFRTKFAP